MLLLGTLLQTPSTSTIELVEKLVVYAYEQHASDIHIHPERDHTVVRLRIDGVLQDICRIEKNMHAECITRIKVCSRLRTDQHHTPLDGRFHISHHTSDIDVRVSIIPTYHGESVVLRLLVAEQQAGSLHALGFGEKEEAHILNALLKSSGMILATGPTGSGKTTTLYTLLTLLPKKEISIVTLEDPIEYALPGIKQIQINTATDLTFSSGLRSVVRQDPNVIMVGEIRDRETAELAVNSALTGHLLLSTLHTNDAATTLPRLLQMRIEPYLIASTVSLVIGQRLVRKICTHCKQQRALTDIEKKKMTHLLPDADTKRLYFYGAGCDACLHTGFVGRSIIAEVLIVDTALEEAILRSASASEIRSRARAGGMTTMLEDGYQKAKAGITTIGEVIRVIHEYL